MNKLAYLENIIALLTFGALAYLFGHWWIALSYVSVSQLLSFRCCSDGRARVVNLFSLLSQQNLKELERRAEN
jgi:hypothetical protein